MGIKFVLENLEINKFINYPTTKQVGEIKQKESTVNTKQWLAHLVGYQTSER